MTKIITTTEGSYLGLYIRDNLEQRPQDFILNVADFEAASKKRREDELKANPPKPEPVRVEFNRLRGELFRLKQNAHSMETRVNNTAGNIKQHEQSINSACKEKKQYEDSGNLRAARAVEHTIQQLENELAEYRERFVKEQRANTGDARALRDWQTENGPRLKELEKEVASLPTRDYAAELEKSFKK